MPSTLSRTRRRTAVGTARVAAALLGLSVSVSSWAQDAGAPANPAPEYKVKPLDPQLCNDKRRKEKNEFLNPEKFDLAALEAYYRECLFARLTQPDAISINQAREELLIDIDTIERKSKGSSEVLGEFNKMLARQLREIIAKDNEGKTYHPSSRIVAAVLAARLNRQPQTPQSGALPDPEGARILIGLLVPTENDGMVATALSHLPRHWSWPGMDERMMESAKTRFITSVQAFLAAQKLAARGQEEEDYLKELMIENLTIIATGKGESAKQALPVLLSLITPAIKNAKSESEWLVERSLWSLGQLTSTGLPPEEIKALERGSVQFLATSLDTWTKRCNQTTSAASGGYPGRGGPGGGGPGLGGAGAGGMMGGDDPGSAPGGGAGGPPGFGQKEPKAKNPFDEQPKEVRNARRILQQRLERIHYGLNGFGKKSTATPSKGLFAWADDNQKAQIAKILASIESLQGILNSDKMSSLDKVTSMTRRPIYDLQQACTAITGDDTVALVVPPPTDDSGTDEPSSGDGFGNEN
ncbi:MAG: hypothetical protein WCI02_11490 [Planctomycetota bacterium]